MQNLTKPQRLIYETDKFAGGSIATICGSILFEGTEDVQKIKQCINEIYRINDAFRIKITETNNGTKQSVSDYKEKDIAVLHFDNEDAFSSYAQNLSEESMDMYGELCDIRIVILPNKYGILTKLHHLIGDAWTLTLIATQFSKLLNGEEVIAYSYCDYIEAEQKYFESKRFDKDKTYWTNQFKKCDEPVLLSEKEVKTYKSTRKTFTIDKEQTKLISDFTIANNSSMYGVLMTAVSVYFNRIRNNAEKFYIGTAVLNRMGLQDKNTMGMFINTAPVLIELNNEESFAENMVRVNQNSTEVFRHQKYNYSDILKDIRNEYKFTGKLYDIMFSYQNAQVDFSGKPFETSWYHPGMQSETLEIHVDDRDNEGILKIHYDYQIEKLSEHQIEKIHEHLFNLLFDAIENADKPINNFEILSDTEKQQLLFAFNNTKVEYPKDKCVHTLFEEQAEKTPDKIAVIATDKTLTYRELNEEANKIAHSLVEKGVKPNDIVAFMLPRKSFILSVMFGILKSGAAYMPTDTDLPQDRIDYMLSDSNAKMCITEENINELLNNSHTDNPCVDMISDNLCYCIYTSGSTGKPKSTAIMHQNMVNFCNNNEYNNYQYSVLNDCEVLLATFKTCFDAFGVDSHLFLLNGKTIVFTNEQEMSDAEHLAKLGNKHKVDVINSTPTMVSMLIENQQYKDMLANVKVMMIAAEEFRQDLYEKIEECTNAKIFNGYGPSETTIGVSFGEVIDGDITIGKPIANTQIYILDKYGKSTPIGVTGEICIAGDCVGAGYLNRPELTAEKFVDNPFGNGKMYKTGDLAYWREDGNIVYVGRNDFQVKIRGLRIELGEIENAICMHENISQAVVVVRKDDNGRQLICAFYTEKEHTDISEIKKNISDKLPKYMMPHIFTVLDEMPLTSSGKINRKALPDVDLNNISNSVEYVAPTTDKEIILCNAISEVLNIEKVSIKDNFFDLGGDSLKAIELIAKLENNGVKTTVKTIFDCETVEELANDLTENIIHNEIKSVGNTALASQAQIRVYTAQTMQGASTGYNVPYAFKVKNLDTDKLQYAVDKMLERHDILRTHFESKDGEIVQIVDNVNLKIEQLKTDNILDFIRPFDLSKAPLMRVGFYENTVMIDLHHIITDGTSMPIFIKELNEFYCGREPKEKTIQYREVIGNSNYADSEKYWLSVFDEVPILEINTDFPRGTKQTFSGDAIYDTIDLDLHNKILKKSKELNTTPFVFYMAGFNILLSKFSGNEDIVVGMPTSGRNSENINSIGMFVNTIAMRNKPIGTLSVSEFIENVKINSINALEYQDYPYNLLTKKLGIESKNRNPLFDVMFAYQSEEMTDVVFGDEKAEILPIPITTSKYDFTFNVMPRDKDTVIMAEYCTDIYKGTTITRFIDAYKRILKSMLDEKQCLCDISVMSVEEYNKVIYEFNDTKVDYPKDKCVHSLFEEQVKKTPDKIAVIATDRTLTYKELNEEANKIAHSLIEKGVKLNDIVAFMLPRRSFLLSVMFGILKSGAAYMPIDPDYPQDRIDYMLSDSNAKMCITEDNLIELLNNSNAENPSVDMTSENLCYCIYTSGSTGKPKSTAIMHQNMVNFCDNNNNNYQSAMICKGEVLLATFKTCFDAFGVDSHLFLLNGKTIVFTSENEMSNAEHLAKLGNKYKVDVIHSTPTMVSMLTENQQYKDVLANVKVMMIAAEEFRQDLYDKIRECTNAKIFNGYGPSETTIGVSFGEVIDGDITIGKPIANTQIYILDKYGKPVPIGVTGELCIAGDCVGAGYLNRPELTAEKFVNNPFGEGKMYKTGDLAYWREDGNIVYVGRNDFQVKIRGLRIELGEIENAICMHENILQAVVVVRKDDNGRQLICAFYTEKEHTDISEIKKNISDKLPKYMMPHIFTVLDEMPLTSSGKINRKALPDVDLNNIDNSVEYVKPQTELEKEIVCIMESVLNYSPIGLNDDFFDLGGDSLKAIEFVSKAHNEGVYFDLKAVFDNPTPKRLCKHLNSANEQSDSYRIEDFEKYDEILSKNTLEGFTVPKKSPIGNVLITGATGFLGIHILDNYLQNEKGIAYCLVRGKTQQDSEQRLNSLLCHYFGDKYKNADRIKVVCGDITDTITLDADIDMVINSAALVKHYGLYDYFYKINVNGTKNAIAFAKEKDAKFIHISTTTVGGNIFGDDFDISQNKDKQSFSESNLYIEQKLDNVYVHSKFEAEKLVLDEIKNGLKANICRMGNLMNRFSDSVFQPNYESSAFVMRVKAALEFGMIPDYLLHLYTEFSPIDYSAEAVMTIARHFNTNYTVFHINNHKTISFERLVDIIKALGINFNVVSGEVFANALKETAKNSDEAYIFEAFINDMDEQNRLVYDSNIRIENNFTVKYLNSLGFDWCEIDKEYIKKWIEYFRKIGYLEV